MFYKNRIFKFLTLASGLWLFIIAHSHASSCTNQARTDDEFLNKYNLMFIGELISKDLVFIDGDNIKTHSKFRVTDSIKDETPEVEIQHYEKSVWAGQSYSFQLGQKYLVFLNGDKDINGYYNITSACKFQIMNLTESKHNNTKLREDNILKVFNRLKGKENGK